MGGLPAQQRTAAVVPGESVRRSGLGLPGVAADDGQPQAQRLPGEQRFGQRLLHLSQAPPLRQHQLPDTALQARFGVDVAQARRVRDTALQLQDAAFPQADPQARRELAWACDLHELGLAVSHHDYHRHSAYLMSHLDAVFLKLSSLAPITGHRRLLTAPTQLHARMLDLLRKVTDAARHGQTARVVVKVNSLTDPALTDALVLAGQAGAQVDLIVRGACILRPGVPGLTDNVRVRSVIGRFLEHTRVFYFRWGDAAAPEEALYLSSADWMSRNMLRRVEVAWPILNEALRQRVIDECVTPYLLDEQDAWLLQASGEYTRAAEQGLSAQQALMQLHGQVGG